MKKLKLDDLKVESFVTSEVAFTSGTVRGNAETQPAPATPLQGCPVISDDDPTCPPSCYGTCYQQTCRRTYCGEATCKPVCPGMFTEEDC